jgi:hypothetical protein
MRITILNKLGALAAALVLAGVGLLAATGIAAAGQVTSAAEPAFNLNGFWTDYGTARPSISTSNGNVFVNMSYAHRPTGTGVVVDATTIVVTYPDAGTLIGKLQTTNVIHWSDNSTWAKVYSGQTTFSLGQTWWDRPERSAGFAKIRPENGYLTVDMSGYHRPNAFGFVISPTTFFVRFPDNAAYVGTITEIGLIRWSNNSFWYPPIF